MQDSIKPEEQLVVALYVRDIRSSAAFYRRLGFTLVRDEGVFVELRWEQSPLFLVERDEVSLPLNQLAGNIRILVSDVDAAWKSVRELGLEVIQPIATRTYGLRDFIIAGPDGLAIRFAATFDALKKKPDA
jgi:catechol 2,3-dioxygenase-like lactoylglutathione lyase family enzyme